MSGLCVPRKHLQGLTKKNARDLSTHPLNVATIKLDDALTRFFMEVKDAIITGNYSATLRTDRWQSCDGLHHAVGGVAL